MDVWETITMKDLILALASASAAVIGVVLVEILFGRRTYGLLEKHDEKCSDYKDNLSKEHNDLSKEHNSLSKEHMELVNNQRLIYDRQNETANKIFEINNMLHEDKVDQKYLRENMNEHQKSMKESFDNINAIFTDWKNQIIIIERLQEELRNKDMEIERLKGENRELQKYKKRERDIER